MVKRDEPASRQPVEEHSKALFDASVGSLDGRTRSALTRARHAALAELNHAKRPLMWRILGPVGGVVAAGFVLVVMLAPLRHTPTSADGPTLPFEDLDIVAATDDLDLLRNLDFYAWLDSGDVGSSDPAARP